MCVIPAPELIIHRNAMYSIHVALFYLQFSNQTLQSHNENVTEHLCLRVYRIMVCHSCRYEMLLMLCHVSYEILLCCKIKSVKYGRVCDLPSCFIYLTTPLVFVVITLHHLPFFQDNLIYKSCCRRF